MHEINEILKQQNIHPKKYIKKNKVTYIETDKEKYIIKEKNKNNNYIYNYLKSRNFDYIPKILYKNDNYEITSFIEKYDIPREQKIIDLINLISLLHNKTTHFKEITEDDYKEIYEDLQNNIEHIESYYEDLITIIETKVYMSPCEYLIARNITKIFQSINFSKKELKKWYEIVKEKRKQRLTVLHNNLELDHYISNEKKYLISWDKSKIGIPIFDIYKLYKKHALEFDFSELLKIYEKNYTLLDEERKLLFILIAIPEKINLNQTEYENTKKTGKMMDYIYKTEKLISPYYPNERPENNTNK